MTKKNLPNDHFFSVLQGNTDIGGLTFQCGLEGRKFTYENSESSHLRRIRMLYTCMTH